MKRPIEGIENVGNEGSGAAEALRDDSAVAEEDVVAVVPDHKAQRARRRRRAGPLLPMGRHRLLIGGVDHGSEKEREGD